MGLKNVLNVKNSKNCRLHGGGCVGVDNGFNKNYTFSRTLKGGYAMKPNVQLPEELFREKVSLVPAVRDFSIEKKDGSRIYGSVHAGKKIRFVLVVLEHAFPKKVEQVIREVYDGEK